MLALLKHTYPPKQPHWIARKICIITSHLSLLHTHHYTISLPSPKHISTHLYPSHIHHYTSLVLTSHFTTQLLSLSQLPMYFTTQLLSLPQNTHTALNTPPPPAHTHTRSSVSTVHGRSIMRVINAVYDIIPVVDVVDCWWDKLQSFAWAEIFQPAVGNMRVPSLAVMAGRNTCEKSNTKNIHLVLKTSISTKCNALMIKFQIQSKFNTVNVIVHIEY